MAQAGRDSLLAGLCQQIEGMERGRASERPTLAFGAQSTDGHLPHRGLTL